MEEEGIDCEFQYVDGYLFPHTVLLATRRPCACEQTLLPVTQNLMILPGTCACGCLAAVLRSSPASLIFAL